VRKIHKKAKKVNLPKVAPENYDVREVRGCAQTQHALAPVALPSIMTPMQWSRIQFGCLHLVSIDTGHLNIAMKA
jgi:hypothetical protein